ncbi:MAG: dicarboxylate/amino acid:cation symporter [Lachnospiraceae bacterium]|nr:dicarboxylate/amino acid:cation symporter [Lachnospiraceae bacterium]
MKELWSKWKKLSLLLKLLFAMIIGIALGLIFGEKILVVKPLGTLFLNLLKMCALPMILCSIIAGITGVKDAKSVGRAGVKILIYYLGTTILAAAVALLVTTIIKPGVGFELTTPFDGTITELPSILETFVNLFPSNIFGSLSSGSFAHALVFAILAGCGALKLPAEEKQKVHDFFETATELIGRILKIALGYAPIGVCVLIACCLGQYGTAFFAVAGKYLAANYVSCILMMVVYLALLTLFTGRNPFAFLKLALPSMMTAFGTQSSAAVLPMNLEAAEKMGGKKSVYSFTIPLGNQINKDGTAILLAASFLFAAQAGGVDISLATMIKVVLMSLLLTVGYGTTVAGGAVVQVTIMIEAFGLPLEIVAVVSGVLALMDGILTTNNNLGDLAGTMIVSDSEKKRDTKLGIKDEEENV